MAKAAPTTTTTFQIIFYFIFCTRGFDCETLFIGTISATSEGKQISARIYRDAVGARELRKKKKKEKEISTEARDDTNFYEEMNFCVKKTERMSETEKWDSHACIASHSIYCVAESQHNFSYGFAQNARK